MARLKQSLKIKKLFANNNKAKYKVKYKYVRTQTLKDNKQTTKYTYSKKIVPIKKKKYSYKKV